MSGSKPGKTIPNGNVASVVVEFLGSILESINSGPLPFSEVQHGRIRKWHARAESIYKSSQFEKIKGTEECHSGSSSVAGNIKTKVNKKKVSAKDKGKLRRQRKALNNSRGRR